MRPSELVGILDEIQYPGYTWHVSSEEGRWYIQATFKARDCKTFKLETQYTRKWYISREAVRSEVVQTALKCVLTSVEHEAREAFKYRGYPIFGPHYDVDQLVELWKTGKAEDLRPQGTP